MVSSYCIEYKKCLLVSLPYFLQITICCQNQREQGLTCSDTFKMQLGNEQRLLKSWFIKKSFVVVSWFSSLFFFIIYEFICLQLTAKFPHHHHPVFSPICSVKCLVPCKSTEEEGNWFSCLLVLRDISAGKGDIKGKD